MPFPPSGARGTALALEDGGKAQGRNRSEAIFSREIAKKASMQGHCEVSLCEGGAPQRPRFGNRRKLEGWRLLSSTGNPSSSMQASSVCICLFDISFGFGFGFPAHHQQRWVPS